MTIPVFATPAAFAATPDGTVYIADYDANRIRRVRIPLPLLKTGGASAAQFSRR